MLQIKTFVGAVFEIDALAARYKAVPTAKLLMTNTIFRLFLSFLFILQVVATNEGRVAITEGRVATTEGRGDIREIIEEIIGAFPL